MKVEGCDLCPNCFGTGKHVPYENAWISDAYAGDILISVHVVYCPECLYQADNTVSLSK